MPSSSISPDAYRLLFENSMDAVFLTVSDGRILAANPAACEMFGMTEAEICAAGRGGLIDPTDARLSPALEERRRAGKMHCELRFVRKDGSLFSGDASSVILGDGTSSFVIVRDITARKTAEEARRESEYRVRHKLNTLLAPDGDIDVLKLADIIDPAPIQSLMEEFFELTQLPMAVLDLEGRVLVGVGWRDICTKFHRVNPEASRNCLESDVQLSSGVSEGEYKLYRCRNNMWDVATPLMVGGTHVGNIFMGQFFFEDEPLDHELFRSQARRYGFDEREYLAALEAVPRITRDTLDSGMRFFQKFAGLISRLSYSNLKLARTLTEREQAERQIRLQASMLDAVGQGVIATDVQNNIMYWNNAATALFGWQREEVIGRNIMDVTIPQIAQQQAEEIMQALFRGEAWTGEFPVQRKDGTVLNVLVTDAPVYEHGHLIGVIGVSTDMTERKRAEEALRETKAAAEEASRAKSEFLANMSHEIRTPMTVFLAAIEYLLQIDSDPEHRHLLSMADQSATRLRSLIDDILDFSRIEARRVAIKKEPFELRACLRNATEIFALPAREKNLRFQTDVSPGVPDVVIGDPDRLGQVLINLIGNAVKFTHQGEVRVSVEPRGDLLEFTVADTGIGIPEEKCDLLFQTFSQVDSTFTRKYGGTGLGLAISKGLVELMGGEISVQSCEGKGSLFIFTIPLKTVDRQSTAPGEALPEKPCKESSAARILLAEDEPMVREIITLMLKQRGWEVVKAESGRDAVERWEGGNFDIVLMDLQMPEMNGLEATQTIRRREAGRRKRTCIIGLTAHARREIKEQCLASGMDEVLIKPVRMQDLHSVVEAYLLG